MLLVIGYEATPQGFSPTVSSVRLFGAWLLVCVLIKQRPGGRRLDRKRNTPAQQHPLCAFEGKRSVMKSTTGRQEAITAVINYKPLVNAIDLEGETSISLYGSNVFNDKVMRELLPKSVYKGASAYHQQG
jgi:hypothetical protein